ncbi:MULTISPECIES: NADPH-dependent FMN reductase [Dermacoccus]|uniref:NADPH-dependent oxidoreductase n=2 Tax=Dermacoccus TaxID=57495 RepID=A0A417Z7C6_9MICO|nr:NAD(P)H-dependent oxidoreductase [Dermacoccus abyssi]RHW46522.1 NADPH-dependent oxidoreductase [Dermacoccus abyssi]
MKIGVILGSIRDSRDGAHVAHWVLDQAASREDAQFELIDLAKFDVPLLTSVTLHATANRSYDSEQVTAWSKAIDACDAFIFVTPEHNHSVPGAFKNAVDVLGPEWQGKAVGLVSYGADGGVRAVEHWRQILANFQMVVVRQQVSLSLFTEFGENSLALEERREAELSTLFDQVIAMGERLA